MTFDDTGANKTVSLANAVISPGSITVNNSTGNDYSIVESAANPGGKISGTTGLTKSGAGKLTLGGAANDFLGPVAIQNGTLVLATAGAMPNNANIILGSGATSGVLDLNGNNISPAALTTSGTGANNTVGSSSTAAAVTFSGNSTFGGNIVDVIGTNSGQIVSLNLLAGTLTLTGVNTYTGATTMSAGTTLQIGNGGASGSLGATTVSFGDATSTLIFNRSGATRFDGALSGAGTLQQIGTGTTTLTGGNSNTGATTISAGAIQLGDPTVNGGTTGILGTGAVTNNGTLIFNRADGDATTPIVFTNVISGTGGLLHNGTGAVRLTGLNTFTGNVVVNAGTLIAQTTQQDTGATEALGNMQVTARHDYRQQRRDASILH